MTRLHPAAPVAKTLRALVGLGAVLALAVVASGCVGGGQAPAPTPDPFAGLADRSDQAFRQGLEAYGQGQYREALTSFEQARTLSPSGDPRIQQMIDRTRAAMAPTPTPVPPTPTEVAPPPPPPPGGPAGGGKKTAPPAGPPARARGAGAPPPPPAAPPAPAATGTPSAGAA